MVIYTIGVPDDDGFGGDDLVPFADQVAIENQVLQRSKKGPLSLFLKMPGATHVTNWWVDQKVLKTIQETLSAMTTVKK